MGYYHTHVVSAVDEDGVLINHLLSVVDSVSINYILSAGDGINCLTPTVEEVLTNLLAISSRNYLLSAEDRVLILILAIDSKWAILKPLLISAVWIAY